MTTHAQVVDRWLHNVSHPEDAKRDLKSHNMPVAFDAVYSYGPHFPLIEAVRNETGSTVLLLLNGDRYSRTTNRHQSTVRDRVAHNNSIPHVIVPFSALNAAGIDRSSIRLIDRSEDGYRTVKCRSRQPRRWWSLKEPGLWEDYSGNVYARDADGIIRWTEQRHVLGESTFIATVHWTEQVVNLDKFTWNGSRVHQSHRVPVRRQRAAQFLSGFDCNEPNPLYFLSELPRVGASTIEEAYLSLKPDVVVQAEAMGREVKRQGDVFAIPMDLTTRQLTRLSASRAKGAHVLGTNHAATEVAFVDGQTLGRGILWHRPQETGWWGNRRRPDHVRLPLGKAWHLLVKNTVPVQVA